MAKAGAHADHHLAEVHDVKALLDNARKDTRGALDQYGHYKSSYMMTPEQIHTAILYKIACNQRIPLHEAYNMCNVTCLNEGADYTAVLADPVANVGFKFDQGIYEAAQNQKPSLFVIRDELHFALVGVIPAGSGAVSIQYFNSVTGRGEQGNVGRQFANTLAKHIGRMVPSVNYVGFADKSIEQQYENCCGLSVADNAADIVTHPEHWDVRDNSTDWRFAPRNEKEKADHYAEFGREAFMFVNTQAADYIRDTGAIPGNPILNPGRPAPRASGHMHAGAAYGSGIMEEVERGLRDIGIAAAAAGFAGMRAKPGGAGMFSDMSSSSSIPLNSRASMAASPAPKSTMGMAGMPKPMSSSMGIGEMPAPKSGMSSMPRDPNLSNAPMGDPKPMSSSMGMEGMSSSMGGGMGGTSKPMSNSMGMSSMGSSSMGGMSSSMGGGMGGTSTTTRNGMPYDPNLSNAPMGGPRPMGMPSAPMPHSPAAHGRDDLDEALYRSAIDAALNQSQIDEAMRDSKAPVAKPKHMASAASMHPPSAPPAPELLEARALDQRGIEIATKKSLETAMQRAYDQLDPRKKEALLNAVDFPVDIGEAASYALGIDEKNKSIAAEFVKQKAGEKKGHQR